MLRKIGKQPPLKLKSATYVCFAGNKCDVQLLRRTAERTGPGRPGQPWGMRSTINREILNYFKLMQLKYEQSAKFTNNGVLRMHVHMYSISGPNTKSVCQDLLDLGQTST